MASDRNTLVGLSKKEVFIIQKGCLKNPRVKYSDLEEDWNRERQCSQDWRQHSLLSSCVWTTWEKMAAPHWVTLMGRGTCTANVQYFSPSFKIPDREPDWPSLARGPSMVLSTMKRQGCNPLQPGLPGTPPPPREGKVGGEKRTYSSQY